MAGGLLQLVSAGTQNMLLNGNPSVSFFKKVYKTYTNFAMESMRVNFNQNSMSVRESVTLVAKIKRNADMIQDVYFCMSIPEIKKISEEKFCFVKHFGETVIKSYEVIVGGASIDKQYGEWMHIWNELSLSSDKRYGYDKMIGNVSSIFGPDNTNKLVTDDVQINTTNLFIPLRFWFNRNPGLALPLIALQYHDVEIRVELRPMLDMYTVNGARQEEVDDYRYYFPNDAVYIDPYLEVNYVYLDTKERNFFAKNSHDYLIEQISVIEKPASELNMNTDLICFNPVKELVWVFCPSDAVETNSWFMYDAREKGHGCSSDKQQSVMRSAKIMFNGLDRLETKPAEYFNLIQPYQHHSLIPSQGINCYSFSIHPENFQPSGACNLARVRKTQLRTELDPDVYKRRAYDLRVFIISYNFLRIMGGMAGVAYA